jgi:hypothetical protein
MLRITRFATSKGFFGIRRNLASLKGSNAPILSQEPNFMKSAHINIKDKHSQMHSKMNNPNGDQVPDADTTNDKLLNPIIIDETVVDPRTHLVNEPIKAQESNHVPEPAFLKPGEGMQTLINDIKNEALDPRENEQKPIPISNLENKIPDQQFKPPFSNEVVDLGRKNENVYKNQSLNEKSTNGKQQVKEKAQDSNLHNSDSKIDTKEKIKKSHPKKMESGDKEENRVTSDQSTVLSTKDQNFAKNGKADLSNSNYQNKMVESLEKTHQKTTDETNQAKIKIDKNAQNPEDDSKSMYL